MTTTTNSDRSGPARGSFDVRLVGRGLVRPPGTTELRRTVRVHHGSCSRDVELVLTERELSAKGVRTRQISQASVWRYIAEDVEHYLNATLFALDCLPGELQGLGAHLTGRVT